jgi:antitoxin component YwqK of YwqJK toxin-antitoxin module
MKVIKQYLLIFFIGFIGCNSSRDRKITKPNISKKTEVDNFLIIDKGRLVLNGNQGNWYYKNQLFNGYAVKYHVNDSIKEKTGFLNGKKQGVYKVWFLNGVLKLESHYKQNKLVGTYKAWWDNGVLASKSNYENGKMQGVSRKWFSNGNLAKERNLLDGKENGLQKAWLENGKLYVNYQAKKGRVFGMKRANSCYKLEDEILVEEK